MGIRVVKRAYKYRFYPTPEQAAELARTFGCVRKVWNLRVDLIVEALRAADACCLQLTPTRPICHPPPWAPRIRAVSIRGAFVREQDDAGPARAGH